MRQETRAPLGMARPPLAPQGPHARGFAVHPWADVMQLEPADPAGLMAPAGELWSTAEDLCRFGVFLLDGDDRVLPAAFGTVHPRWKTPHVALLVQGGVATIFVVAGLIGSTVGDAYLALVDTTIVLFFVPYLYVFAAYLKLRRRRDRTSLVAGVAAAEALEEGTAAAPFKVACSNPDAEHETVRTLFNAMMEAKKKAGEAVSESSFDSVRSFVKKKTAQIRKDSGCHAVEYSVEVQDGQVRLKAKAKI